MITFNSVGLLGRLGNQLFQYSILLAVQQKRGFEIKLPNFNGRIHHGQECLLNNFNISSKFLDKNDIIQYQYIEPEIDQFKYNPSVFLTPDNTDFYGFFQHGKYYEDEKCFELIKKELSLKENILLPNIENFNKIKEQYKGYLIVSLHLRRGDSSKDMFGNDLNILDKNSLWYEYFNRASKYFENKKVKFLLFTGGIRGNEDPSSEYQWCRNNFKGEEFIILDEQRDTINDFALMKECDHHILSPVSTFSYMVGYLNKDKVKDGKIIITPEKYRFLRESHGKDFYPPEFILV